MKIEAEFFPLVVKGFDPLKEWAVEVNRVLMRGELGRHVALDFLQLGIGIGAREIGKNAIDPVEQIAGFLEGDDRVLERGRLGIGGDGRDLPQLPGHALFIGGREILVLDLVERRVMEIERTFLEQRIFGHRCGARGRRGRLFRCLAGADKEEKERGGHEGAGRVKRAKGAGVLGDHHSSLGWRGRTRSHRPGAFIYIGIRLGKGFV